jgi:hypothetical protein
MSIITLNVWKSAVAKVKLFNQSPQLKDLIRTSEMYTKRATKANFEQLADPFSTWRYSEHVTGTDGTCNDRGQR